MDRKSLWPSSFVGSECISCQTQNQFNFCKINLTKTAALSNSGMPFLFLFFWNLFCIWTSHKQCHISFFSFFLYSCCTKNETFLVLMPFLFLCSFCTMKHVLPSSHTLMNPFIFRLSSIRNMFFLSLLSPLLLWSCQVAARRPVHSWILLYTQADSDLLPSNTKEVSEVCVDFSHSSVDVCVAPVECRAAN